MVLLYNVTEIMSAVIVFDNTSVYVGINGARGWSNRPDWMRNMEYRSVALTRTNEQSSKGIETMGYVHAGIQ